MGQLLAELPFTRWQGVLVILIIVIIVVYMKWKKTQV